MNIKVLITISAIFLLSSCSQSLFYYQLYKTESNQLIDEGKELVYEDEKISIVYNFWSEYGNTSFTILNKTDKEIFIDMRKSHLIINGIAQTYFQNRSFANTYSSGIVSGKRVYNRPNILRLPSSESIETQSSKSSTTTNYEEEVIIVPPKAGKSINGFVINSSVFRDCNLLRVPKKDDKKTVNFSKNESPFIVKNYLSYGHDLTDLDIVTNEFWVKEISNLSEKEFLSQTKSTFCGETLEYSKATVFLKFSPSNFYIKYKRPNISQRSTSTAREFKH